MFLCEFADALRRVGRAAEGLAAIDEALARREQNEERWYLAELLRIKGELVLRQGGTDAPREAERFFLDSLGWSRRQQTAAWELRAATSLAGLRRSQGLDAAARDLLAPVHASFQEGLETADVRAARELLAALAA